MKDKIPVVAGTYEQFVNEFHGNPNYFFVNKEQDLWGLHGVKVILCGTYYERCDWDEIQEAIVQAENS